MIPVAVEASALQGERSGVGSYLINLLYYSSDPELTYLLFLGRGWFPAARARVERQLERLTSPERCRVVVPRFPFRPRWLTERLYEDWYLPRLLRRSAARLYFAPNYLLPAKLPPKLASVITVHDVTFLRHPELVSRGTRQKLSRRLKASCDRADGIITVSRATRDDLVDLLGVPEERIRVIHEGTSIPPSPAAAVEDQVLARFGIREPFAFFLGNLEPRKNLVRLVRAHHQVAGSSQLVLGGSTGWHYPELHHELKGKQVVVTGYLRGREVGALLRRALFFAYPSLYEGFGLPPLEAMSVGCPVLAGRAGALPEILGDAVEWVNPLQTEDIARGLEKLWRDNAWRELLRRRGYARAATFLWSRTAAATAAFFKELAG